MSVRINTVTHSYLTSSQHPGAMWTRCMIQYWPGEKPNKNLAKGLLVGHASLEPVDCLSCLAKLP